MTNEEIIKNHAEKNLQSGNAAGLMTAISNMLQQGFKIVRFNDVLFVHKDSGSDTLFSIINGGAPKQYLQAIKKFIAYAHSKKITHFMMYVSDTTSSKNIAKAAGMKNVHFEKAGQDTGGDNYILIASA